MKIVFFSGDDYAVSVLDRLSEKVEVKVLVTHPLKPKGRGLKPEVSLLAKFAEKKGIKVLTPDDPNSYEFCERLRGENADAGVLVSYRHIIKTELLNLFPKGFINLHPSLLPKYRGASPIARAILNGERITGATTILMTERVDAGPIILQERIEIGENETGGELKERLFLIGSELLWRSLQLAMRGEIRPTPQDDSLATYAPSIKKEELAISWEETKVAIHNKIRAFSPKPGAWTFFRNQKAIILQSEVTSLEPRVPGEILVRDDELFVSAKDGLLKLNKIKVAGKQAISGRDFCNGYKPKPGERFSLEGF